MWTFRVALEKDRDFIFNLYEMTMRQVVVETWGWDDAWQRNDFDRRFHSYPMRLIEIGSLPIGAVCFEWLPRSLYIHEIQLLPEYQGRGIGAEVLRSLLTEAANRRCSVALSVVAANGRARELYERLGFKVTSVEAPFTRMELDSAGEHAV